VPNHAGDLSRATGHLRAAVAKQRGRPPAAPFLLQGRSSSLLSQILDCGAQVASRGAATPPQQENSNSAGLQRNSLSITGFICTVCKAILATMYLRRVGVLVRHFAAALTHVSTAVTTPAPAADNLKLSSTLRIPIARH
jgi:hypothetical protein